MGQRFCVYEYAYTLLASLFTESVPGVLIGGDCCSAAV